MKNDSHKLVHKYKLREAGLTFIIVCSILYDGIEFWSLYTKNIAQENKIVGLENTLAISEKNLSLAKEENKFLNEALLNEQQTNNSFQAQIQNITGTLGTLEKLSKTDPELLKKYSKVYFLNENYTPQNLTLIPEKYLNIKNKPLQIRADVLPHLEKLQDDANSEAISIQILSAYRSFGEQTSLKSSYKITYGAGTANAFSAEQGYSEHQLGTTVDFTTVATGASLTDFEKTGAYKWLVSNAYKYGFIMSYPKENTYYVFEPWHFRFVGTALAQRLHDNNLYFYSLDQREIDKYLITLFD